MITYQVENLPSLFDELKPLLEKHYQELTLHKHVVKLSPDWVAYTRMQDKDLLVAFTAREGAKLVGYAIFFVGRHLHYDLKVATNDLLFLDENYRKGLTGVKLIKYAEKELERKGVQKIVWHAKQSNYLAELLIALGYGVEDIILGKIVGE